VGERPLSPERAFDLSGTRNSDPSLTARWSNPPTHRPLVVFAADGAWSIYGAERAQPVAIGGKWEGPKNGKIRPNPLPWVATSCQKGRMVRRGSTVRVRQRASRNALQNGYLSCLSGKRLSRAGTRGHYLVFPRQAYRQVVFGLIKLIRTDLTPSVPRRDLAESARHIEMSGKGDAGVAHVQHGGDSFGENRWSVVGAQPKRRVRRERRARQGSPFISRSRRAWLPPSA
jgi:hypothetical protein